MEYTKEQINFIQSRKPEFIPKPVPSLDAVIVEFLKRYEVYVKPASSSKRTSDDVASWAVAGAIGGFAGADVAGDAFIIRGQQKQTAIQEWTQWKQWALDHKDFEAFRAENIDKVKKDNEIVLNKLKDSDFKDIELLFKKASGGTWSTGAIIYTSFAFTVCVVPIVFGILSGLGMFREKIKDSNNTSFYYQEFIDNKWNAYYSHY